MEEVTESQDIQGIEPTVLDEDQTSKAEFAESKKLTIKPAEQKRSKLVGTHFQRLARSEAERTDIEELLAADKIFVIFTRAGKPVYSS